MTNPLTIIFNDFSIWLFCYKISSSSTCVYLDSLYTAIIHVTNILRAPKYTYNNSHINKPFNPESLKQNSVSGLNKVRFKGSILQTYSLFTQIKYIPYRRVDWIINCIVFWGCSTLYKYFFVFQYACIK